MIIILLTKLKEIGLSGNMLSWFHSYLDRTQRVRHNGNVSSEKKLEYSKEAVSAQLSSFSILRIE